MLFKSAVKNSINNKVVTEPVGNGGEDLLSLGDRLVA